jgi:3-methyladenine DNA glycosylase AlkD
MHDAAFDICDRLIGDRDDMVQKAVGWLLKEISRTEPRVVLEYLLEHRDLMSRLTLRYAAEKLPDHMRRRLFPS